MDGDIQNKLQERVEEADNALALHSHAPKTVQWAAANFELASALAALATNSDDRSAFDYYIKAIEIFEVSLKFYKKNTHLKSEYQETIVAIARTIGAYTQRESGDNSRLALIRAKKLLLQFIDEQTSNADLFNKAVILVELGKLHRIHAELIISEEKNTILKEAINAFKKAAQIFQTKEKFENWAEAVLGEAIAWREISTLNIEEPLKALLHSVEMLKTVLNYYSAENHPIEWFYGHLEYGRAFFRIALLNENEKRRDAASAAVDAMGIALQTNSSEINPQIILRLRIELAFALSTYAQTLEPAAAIKNLKTAINIYNDLIAEFKQDGDIYKLALMQGNRGRELLTIANLYHSQGNENECLHCYEQAIEVFRQNITDQLKRIDESQWLANKIDIAKALYNYANHLNGKKRIDTHLEAIEIYRTILTSVDNDRSLTGWRLKVELAFNLSHYVHNYNPDNSEALLQETTAIYQKALKYHKEIGKHFDPFVIEAILGKDLITLATFSDGKEGQSLRFQAIDILRQCISPTLEAQNFDQWLSIIMDLGMAFYANANNDDSTKRFALYEETIEIFRQILQKINHEENSELAAQMQNCIALSLASIGESDQSDKGLQQLKEAELAFRLALQMAEKRDNEIELMRIESNIANLLYTLARRSVGEEAKSYSHYAAQMSEKAIKRISKEAFPNEWLTSQSNYGLILKYMVENGYSDDLEHHYKQAIIAFEEALSTRTMNDAIETYIFDLQNLIATFISFAGHCQEQEKHNILNRANALLSEIEQWAHQQDKNELIDKAREGMQHIALLLQKHKPKSLLKRLLPFLK